MFYGKIERGGTFGRGMRQNLGKKALKPLPRKGWGEVPQNGTKIRNVPPLCGVFVGRTIGAFCQLRVLLFAHGLGDCLAPFLIYLEVEPQSFDCHLHVSELPRLAVLPFLSTWGVCEAKIIHLQLKPSPALGTASLVQNGSLFVNLFSERFGGEDAASVSANGIIHHPLKLPDVSGEVVGRKQCKEFGRRDGYFLSKRLGGSFEEMGYEQTECPLLRSRSGGR